MMKTFNQAKSKQETLFVEISKLLGALSSPVRLKIIHFLSQAPHSVEQLANKIGQSLANTSMHLNKMQREELLTSRVSAQKRIYEIKMIELKDFWEHIQNFALVHKKPYEQDIIDTYQKDLVWQENVEKNKSFDEEMEKVFDLLKENKAVLVDTRPYDEIDVESEGEEDHKNHRSILKEKVIHAPYQEVEKLLKKKSSKDLATLLPKDKILFIICRGKLCVVSLEITSQLKSKGWNAYRLNTSWHFLNQKLHHMRRKK